MVQENDCLCGPSSQQGQQFQSTGHWGFGQGEISHRAPGGQVNAVDILPDGFPAELFISGG